MICRKQVLYRILDKEERIRGDSLLKFIYIWPFNLGWSCELAVVCNGG